MSHVRKASATPAMVVVLLGLLPATCYLATGPKWADITFSSPFILEPGALMPQVSRYLKIDTDERGSCRREKDGRCLEPDDVFSLAGQRSLRVEADARTDRVEALAGHGPATRPDFFRRA